MKNIFLCLLLIGCNTRDYTNRAVETKFKYNDRVIVTDGFYEGFIGIVYEEGKSYSDCRLTYKIRFEETIADSYICNSKLMIIKETK